MPVTQPASPSAAFSRQPLPLPRLPPPPPHRRRWPTTSRRRREVRERPALRVANRRRRGVRERPALRGPAGTRLGNRACAARCASHRPLSVEASPKRHSAAPDSQPQSPPSPQPPPSAKASPERCTADDAGQPQSPPSPRAIPPRVRCAAGSCVLHRAQKTAHAAGTETPRRSYRLRSCRQPLGQIV